jgi:hypothetical protein
LSRFSHSGTPAAAPARACDSGYAEPAAGADARETARLSGIPFGVPARLTNRMWRNAIYAARAWPPTAASRPVAASATPSGVRSHPVAEMRLPPSADWVGS